MTTAISRELYRKVLGILKCQSFRERQDAIFDIVQEEDDDSNLAGQINQIIFDHSCRKCMHIMVPINDFL